MKYKRILLKLSGEALLGSQSHGIDPQRLYNYCNEIKAAVEMGIEVAIVIGGGNIFRGMSGTQHGIERVKGDYMGMLATVINGLALQSEFTRLKCSSRLITAIPMEPVAEYYSKIKALTYLNKKEIVIFTFGTGNPYFTTDSAAALRAIEIEADVLLKGTRVDGIYSEDPEKNPKAERFSKITYEDAYNRGLKIMDLTAFTMCRENNMPLIVFDMNTTGNLKKLLEGEENIGTLVFNSFD